MKGTTAMSKSATTMPCRPRKHIVAQAFHGMTDAPGVSNSVRQGTEDSMTTRQAKADTENLIRLLNEALATEISCILRYKRHYCMTTKISARGMKATFLQRVTEKQHHADQLAKRIVQLGGEAILPFERLLNRSHAEYVEGDSLEEMTAANLLTERGAIQNYRKMISSVGADDPTTRRILERILAQKEAYAENLVSLVRD